jgi:hypothetical protein
MTQASDLRRKQNTETTTMAKAINVELAVKDEHGTWELVSEFATVEAAQDAAKEYAAQGQYHVDDHGVMVFGISDDLASGHYETTYSVEVATGEAWAV